MHTRAVARTRMHARATVHEGARTRRLLPRILHSQPGQDINSTTPFNRQRLSLFHFSRSKRGVFARFFAGDAARLGKRPSAAQRAAQRVRRPDPDAARRSLPPLLVLVACRAPAPDDGATPQLLALYSRHHNRLLH
eukprot:2650226-Pleurochrysis_carterae.AAC.1